VALDSGGRVRAMVGGRDWEQSKVNLAVGRSGGGRGRQGGSTFKAFVLAETVHEGYSVESAFKGPARIKLPKADNGHDWSVSNFEGESFDRLNLVDATVHSVNTIYAQLVTAVGPAKVAAMAEAMGIQTHLNPVASITLGTQDVSVLDMADAYLTLANRGMHVDPQVVAEVDDAEGKVIERFTPQHKRVLERSQADVVNFVLRQVVERGTGTGADFGRPVAGKTGTTQDFGDAWFVGYTPSLTTAVWMGYPEGQSRAMVAVHGRKVNGGSFPAAIFKRFMAAATKGMDNSDFPSPPNLKGRLVSGDRIRFTEETTSPSTTGPAATSPVTTTTAPKPGPAPTPSTTSPPPTTTAPPPPVTTTTRAPPGRPVPS